MSNYGFCPECDEEVRMSKKPRLGQLVSCRSCGEELQVVGLRPLELDYALVEDDQEFSVNGFDEYEYDDRW